MSRIGKLPVALPKGVDVKVADGSLRVKGPKGALTRSIVSGISFDVSDGSVEVARSGDTKQERANHGLMRALLANMVTGVSAGFERKLEIHGVGYKAEAKGKKVVFNLGFSHPIEYAFPDGVTVEVEKGGKLKIKGIDKEQVGQAAAVIRGFRPPDSYKGKGIRYAEERVRLKAGKSGQ